MKTKLFSPLTIRDLHIKNRIVLISSVKIFLNVICHYDAGRAADTRANDQELFLIRYMCHKLQNSLVLQTLCKLGNFATGLHNFHGNPLPLPHVLPYRHSQNMLKFRYTPPCLHMLGIALLHDERGVFSPSY